MKNVVYICSHAGQLGFITYHLSLTHLPYLYQLKLKRLRGGNLRYLAFPKCLSNRNQNYDITILRVRYDCAVIFVLIPNFLIVDCCGPEAARSCDCERSHLHRYEQCYYRSTSAANKSPSLSPAPFPIAVVDTSVHGRHLNTHASALTISPTELLGKRIAQANRSVMTLHARTTSSSSRRASLACRQNYRTRRELPEIGCAKRRRNDTGPCRSQYQRCSRRVQPERRRPGDLSTSASLDRLIPYPGRRDVMFYSSKKRANQQNPRRSA